MEEYGSLVKIQMRRQIGGAIVEFANVQDAFKVRQGVDCSSLGAEVRTGDVGDLLAKVKPKQDGAAASGSGMKMAPPPSISRPSQRGGRRGGLGYRSKGAVGAGQSGDGESAEGSSTSGVKGDAKTNAAFRDLFMKGKDAAPTQKD